MNGEKTLRRADIVNAIVSEFEVSKFNAAEIVEDILEEISVALKNDGVVKIAGFGTFLVRQKKERMGRNPKTMKEAVISSRKSLTFRPSSILKKILSSKE